MFARVKKSGKRQYLQIVENHREGKRTVQRVISTIGRIDELAVRGEIETLVRSLARFSDRVLLILSGKSEITAQAKKIGPALIFERLWKELGIDTVLKALLSERKFEFEVERAIFLTVLHRLFVSGSDRFCARWQGDYVIQGVDDLSLHHLYRAMAFLGEAVKEEKDKPPFSPRCIKDLVEEGMFRIRRDLFSGLDLVFFDTTSLYFEGKGGESLGRRGHSKDHRNDLRQMVVGAVLDNYGKPVCCELWPGNTADVKTLSVVVDRIQHRFGIGTFCIVGDRGMVSEETMEELEHKKIPYILGARMRKVKEIREDVLSRAGRYQELYPEGATSKDPAPLKVKEVWAGDRRYVVCVNTKQARKDASDRQAILESLNEQLKRNPKALIGNKGYRK